MNRTYNFQIDNGLFIAEYYIKKDYKDITIEDLKNNIDLLAEKLAVINKVTVLNNQNKPTHLSYVTHHNSALNQIHPTKNNSENIAKQMIMLLDNIGDDKTCMTCGKKQVNVNLVKRTDLKEKKMDYIPANTFMFGLPSKNKFMNMGNNLQTIDVCPVCLFLSLVSLLNTQKIRYPFLFLSDSDEFMRDITAEIQSKVQIKEILDIKKDNVDNYFVDIATELMQSEEIYDDLNYINLIYFQNARENHYDEQTIDKKQIIFLLRLKNKGLITEFYNLKLFSPFLENKFLIPYLVDEKDFKLKCSDKLFLEIREEIMTKEDINMIEYTTDELLKRNEAKELLKELKLCSNKNDFEKFILDKSTEKPIYQTLTDFVKLTSNYYKYYNVLIANLLLKGDS